jgi:hypothetical protein
MKITIESLVSMTGADPVEFHLLLPDGEAPFAQMARVTLQDDEGKAVEAKILYVARKDRHDKLHLGT